MRADELRDPSLRLRPWASLLLFLSAYLAARRKLAHQKTQHELEASRSKLRRELFDRQDEVEAQRDALIQQLEVQLRQQVEERTLLTVEWEMK